MISLLLYTVYWLNKTLLQIYHIIVKLYIHMRRTKERLYFTIIEVGKP